MPNTTNFNWTTPADTDLVKDGAAAIRTLGNGIDTSFVDLKGGTTGQVLSKASNTDLDFSWSSVDPLTILDAKGDLISATAADTPARLAVGANNTVLTADSSTATGLKWATPASGGLKNFTLLNTGGTSLSGAQTITVSGISNQQALLIIINGGSSTSASQDIGIRFNGDTSNNVQGWGIQTGASSNAGYDHTADYMVLGSMSNNAASLVRGAMLVFGTNNAGFMGINSAGMATAGGGSGQLGYILNGFYNGSAAITSVSAYTTGGTFDAGTLFVYGMAA